MKAARKYVIMAAAMFGLCAFAEADASHQADNWYKMGTGALKQEKYDLAISCFTYAIKYNPSDAIYHVRRGEAYTEKDELVLAEKDFKAALAIDSECFPAYFGLCTLYSVTQQNEKALANYNKLIQFVPQVPLGYMGRAEIYKRLGNDAASKADLKKAVELIKALKKAGKPLVPEY